MKAVDTFSIDTMGIPSVVLMERAALAVTERVLNIADSMCEESLNILKHRKAYTYNTIKVLCLCGKGNNGADGLAVARQLNEKGVNVEIMLVSSGTKSGTQEFETQLNIIKNLGIKCKDFTQKDDIENGGFSIIVDGIFGIGLSRDIEGIYAQAIDAVNCAKECADMQINVVSADIPSGINASTAHIMKHAIKADETVTFGYNKVGMSLYPGKEYAGKVTVADIGFAPGAVNEIRNKAFTYTDDDFRMLPVRKNDSNKGTYGKVLIIAGSENMGGAACLCALAACKSGAGLVKVLTHENNRNIVLSHVPEAILITYNKDTDIQKCIRDEVQWASCIVAGPGLSQSETAYDIIDTLLNEAADKPLVLDADALNLIALNEPLKEAFAGNKDRHHIIITPHPGEMSRLCERSIKDVKDNLCEIATGIAQRYGVYCVLKDAATVVSNGTDVYINNAGNPGMATAGSGDVLAGIITGILAGSGINDIYSAVCLSVYLHARSGDMAAKEYGEYSMTAKDIAESVGMVLRKNI